MKMIEARNVNGALPLGLRYLKECGIPMPSRAGEVIVAPQQVTTVITNPLERVLFSSERDAHPFFHFFEGLYYLAGRKDLKFITQFLPRMKDFSDDGNTLQGSYGFRWRHHFGYDQIERIVALLKKQPFSRRAVLTMWDPNTDLQEDEGATKDACCNTQIVFSVSYGKKDEPNRLNTTIFNRSNDLIYGLLGANIVHFSMMHEYLAAKLGLVVGSMTTVSVNYHAYTDIYNKVYKDGYKAFEHDCPYTLNEVAPYPMVEDPTTWDMDLALFMEDPAAYGYRNKWFSVVAKPLYWGHMAARRHAYTNALEILAQCEATDWRRAAEEWVRRRQLKWSTKKKAELLKGELL